MAIKTWHCPRQSLLKQECAIGVTENQFISWLLRYCQSTKELAIVIPAFLKYKTVEYSLVIVIYNDLFDWLYSIKERKYLQHNSIHQSIRAWCTTGQNNFNWFFRQKEIVGLELQVNSPDYPACVMKEKEREIRSGWEWKRVSTSGNTTEFHPTRRSSLLL